MFVYKASNASYKFKYAKNDTDKTVYLKKCTNDGENDPDDGNTCEDTDKNTDNRAYYNEDKKLNYERYSVAFFLP